MRIHPYELAPLSATDTVFSPSRWSLLVALLICVGFAGLGLWLIVHEKAGWFGAVFAGLGGLATVPLLKQAARVFSGRAWVLRLNSGRLLVRLSPVLRGNGAEDRVVELLKSDVAFVRGIGRTTLTKGTSETTHTYTSDLEIQLTPQDLGPLREAIAAANAPRKGRWITTGTDSSLRLTGEGVLVIAWAGRSRVMSPFLKKAIATIGQEFPSRGFEKETLDFRTSEADHAKLDERILDAAERGRTMEAIELTRLRYGTSLSEAKRFVDELRSSTTHPRGSATPPPPSPDA